MTVPTQRMIQLPISMLIVAALALSCGPAGGENTLVMKDGTILKGELLSRTDDGFRFAVGGDVREIPQAQVFSLTLKEDERPLFVASAVEAAPPPVEVAPPPAAPARAAAPAPKPAPAPAPKKAAPPAPPRVAAPLPPRTLTVQSGTRLMLKLDEDISTASHPRGAPISGNLEIQTWLPRTHPLNQSPISRILPPS